MPVQNDIEPDGEEAQHHGRADAEQPVHPDILEWHEQPQGPIVERERGVDIEGVDALLGQKLPVAGLGREQRQERPWASARRVW
jgi:hypothetical protein